MCRRSTVSNGPEPSPKSNDPSDCVFWYKARDDIPRFRLCAPQFWLLDSRGEAAEDTAAAAAAEPEPRGCEIVTTKPRPARATVQRVVKHAALPGV